MNVLLNRSMKPGTDGRYELPADGFYHVVPKGAFKHPEGVMELVDDKSVQSICSRFAEGAIAPNYPGLLVDFDHESHDPSKRSTAAGWIEELANRGDGVWAKIRWSDLGEAAVKGGQYRLASPVFLQGDCEQVGANTVRPLHMARLAITNDPVMKWGVPLSNRQGSIGSATPSLESHAANASGSEPLQSLVNDFGQYSGYGNNANFEALLGAFNNRACRSSNAQRFDSKPDMESIDQIVNAVRKKHPDWTFDQAWNHARLTVPVFFNCAGPARGALKNRGGKLSSQLWDESIVEAAIDNEQDVLDFVQSRISASQQNKILPLTMTGSKIYEALLGNLNTILKNNPGWDISQAWEKFKETDPERFIAYVAGSSAWMANSR